MAVTNSFPLTIVVSAPPPSGYTPLGNTALANAIAALTAGQSAAFALDPSFNIGGNWFTNTIPRWFWGQHKAYFLGKTGGAGGAWRLITYDEASNTFAFPFNAAGTLGTTGADSDFARSNVALDFDGDGLYVLPYLAEQVTRWNVGTAAWVANAGTYVPTAAGGPFGIGWHPNLFGTADGGLVLLTDTTAYVWRKSTDTWTTLSPALSAMTTLPPSATSNQIAVYAPALNKVIVSHGRRGVYSPLNIPFWVVSPGTPPTIEYGGNMPTIVSSYPGTTSLISNRSMMLPTPAGTVAIFECTNAVNPQRVWRLNPVSMLFELQAFEHPFRYTDAVREYTVPMFIPDYNAYWRLSPTATNNPGPPHSLIWKPPVGF